MRTDIFVDAAEVTRLPGNEPWETDLVATAIDRRGLWDTDIPDMLGVR